MEGKEFHVIVAPAAASMGNKVQSPTDFDFVDCRISQDPNKPKRAMSAFFLYSQAFRQQVKDDNPDASFGDVVSHGGQPFCVSSRVKWSFAGFDVFGLFWVENCEVAAGGGIGCHYRVVVRSVTFVCGDCVGHAA